MDSTRCRLSGCDCGSSLEDHDRNAAAQARVQQSPMAALHDISNGKPDLCLFQATVDATVDIPQIWRDGGSGLYVRYIVDGYERATLDRHSNLHSSYGRDVHNLSSTHCDPHWKQPLAGIINVLAGISNTKSSHRDSAIFAKLRKSYYAMCVILRDLDQLLLHGS
jgi:hypothetical protein